LDEWVEIHLVEQEDLHQGELNLEGLKIFFHNLVERVLVGVLNSISETYLVELEDLSQEVNKQNKKFQKKKFQILML
jgi:hypothetical protein